MCFKKVQLKFQLQNPLAGNQLYVSHDYFLNSQCTTKEKVKRGFQSCFVAPSIISDLELPHSSRVSVRVYNRSKAFPLEVDIQYLFPWA